MNRLAPCLVLAVLAACGPTVYTPGTTSEPNPRIVETASGYEVHVRNDNLAMSQAVDAPLDRVWAMLPEVFQELGITAGVLDPETHAFGNQGVNVSRVGGERVEAYVRCGNEGAGPSAANRYRTRLSVVTSLQGAGSRTVVSTLVGGTGTTMEGTSTERIGCVSNGRLEARIAALISQRLNAGRART